jgi:putative salt-induced outer membrane protein YdiY
MNLLVTLLFCAAPQGDLATTPPAALPLLQEPEKTWKGNLDAGATLVSGNNESTTASLNALIDGKWGKWAAGAYAGYTGVRSTDQTTGDATTTARIYTLGANGKRYLGAAENLYAYTKGGDRRDEPSGLVERIDVGAGAGYRFDLYEAAFLGVEAGPSWVSEELVGVTETEETVAVRAAYNFEAPITEKLKAYGNGEYLTGGDVESLTTLTGIRWNFKPKWSFMASLQVNYDGSPAAGFESTDQIFVLGIGISF